MHLLVAFAVFGAVFGGLLGWRSPSPGAALASNVFGPIGAALTVVLF